MNDISYSQMRILEISQSFKQLYNIYCKNGSNDITGIQLKETAAILEEASGINVVYCMQNRKSEKRLRHSLQQRGILLDSIIMYRTRNGKTELSLVIKAIRHECIDISAISETLSEYCNKNMSPAKNGRMIITDHYAEYIFEEASKYFTLCGYAMASKDKGIVSGDSFTFTSERHGKMSAALADGMGSGEKANRTSQEVVELVEQFFEAGFTEENIIKMINCALSSKNEDNPVTLDLMSLDLANANCTLIKAGAAASYIKKNECVNIIKPSSLPAGVIENALPDVTHVKICEGEYIIMVSDGITDSLPFYDKEQHFARIINETNCNNPQIMAETLLEEVMFYQGMERRDDMTVLVTGVWKSGLV